MSKVSFLGKVGWYSLIAIKDGIRHYLSSASPRDAKMAESLFFWSSQSNEGPSFINRLLIQCPKYTNSGASYKESIEEGLNNSMCVVVDKGRWNVIWIFKKWIEIYKVTEDEKVFLDKVSSMWKLWKYLW